MKVDKTAAKRFLAKAIKRNSKASIINIDKSGANTAGIIKYNKLKQKRIKIRRCKYLNNIVEQDHRIIKRITRPMLGFKNFVSAAITLVGIEIVRMLHKGQSRANNMRLMTLPERFRLLAA